MANNLIYNGLDEFAPTLEEDEKGFIPSTDEQQIDNIVEGEQEVVNQQPIAQQPEVIEPTVEDTNSIAYKKKNNIPLTQEEYYEDFGLNELPELKSYTNEAREKRAQKQQDAYNLAQSLRGVFQGIAGSQGTYLDKFEKDTTTPRVQAELQRVRDANDSDKRRTDLANWTRSMRNAELYTGYKTREEDKKFRASESDKQIAAQDARYKQSNEEWERRYGFKADPKYIEEIEQIKAESRIKIANATSALAAEQIQRQLEKEIMVKGLSAGYTREQTQNVIDGIGAFDNPLKGKEPALVVEGFDGKELRLSKSQAGKLAYEIQNAISDLQETNPEAYSKLPMSAVIGGIDPSKSEQETLIRDFYSGKLGDLSLGAAGIFPQGDDNFDEYKEGQSEYEIYKAK